MWREFIQTLAQTDPYPGEIRFFPGASKVQIASLEMHLGVAVPEDLKTLLLESNGIADEYDAGFLWSVERIAQYNQEMRTQAVYKENYMSFNDLFFFADAGNGDHFAFPIIQGKVRPTRIYAWDHEGDSRKEVAFTLKNYFERLFGGKLTV